MRKNTIDATFEYLGLGREDFSEQLQANITDYERIAAQLKKQPPAFPSVSLDVDTETDYAESMRELRSIFEMPRAKASQIFERAGVVGKSENDQWGVNLISLTLADGATKPISPALHGRIVFNYNHLLNQIADRIALQIFEETFLPPQYKWGKDEVEVGKWYRSFGNKNVYFYVLLNGSFSDTYKYLVFNIEDTVKTNKIDVFDDTICVSNEVNSQNLPNFIIEKLRKNKEYRYLLTPSRVLQIELLKLKMENAK